MSIDLIVLAKEAPIILFIIHFYYADNLYFVKVRFAGYFIFSYYVVYLLEQKIYQQLQC